MDYAKESHTGKLVAAADASRWRSYICPRPECSGRVFLRYGRTRRPHFAHYAGEGTPACEEYHPGLGGVGESTQPRVAALEEDPAALSLTVNELDGVWGLNLRLPEIHSDEFGDAGLTTLRTALIDIFEGPHRRAQLSALELRPGVGSARVGVPPSLHDYRAQPTGTWPPTIDHRRWLLRAPGLKAPGTLFRLQRGEWTRLLADSAVHQGETLIFLAEKGSAPPRGVPHSLLFEMSSGGMHWAYWEVRIPDDLDPAGRWLQRLGHDLVPKPWQLTVLTPPRGFTDGVPIFWVGDAPILRVDAPMRSSDTTTLDCVFESNTARRTVATSGDGMSYVTVESARPGLMRFSLGGSTTSQVDLQFVARPTRGLSDVLAEIPRLRIWVGGKCLSAWGDLQYALDVGPATSQPVRVELGHDEGTRARVTVWRGRLWRRYPDLTAREVVRLLEEAFSDEDTVLIEIDAGNLGSLRILPSTVASAQREADHARGDRLVWRDHLLSQLPRQKGITVTAVVDHPKNPSRRLVRSVDAAGLIRSRLILRGRRMRGESSR